MKVLSLLLRNYGIPGATGSVGTSLNESPELIAQESLGLLFLRRAGRASMKVLSLLLRNTIVRAWPACPSAPQ